MAKKNIFPKLMIIFYSASLAIGLIDFLLMSLIPMASELQDGSSIKDIVRSAITCFIWIPYFRKSVRVANTFVK
ncbi:DUF2569 family protein [Paenibacillus sp. MBLB4367]|uniref:DUF2569 family protein n=1 Tax=Paenibacillus sp. MBLB4367 TaxID=3384767 RepID=UPI003908001B